MPGEVWGSVNPLSQMFARLTAGRASKLEAPDLTTKFRRGYRINRMLFAALALGLAGQMLAAPWILAEQPAALWALALGLALLSNPAWLLIHEAIHGLYAGGRRENEFAGRVLSVLLGAPLGVLRGGHLLHHKYNRQPPDRTEVYERGRDNRLLFALQYYAWICGGLYVTEVCGSWLSLAPRRVILALRERFLPEESIGHTLLGILTAPRTLRSLRIDTLAALALFAAALYLYGEHWLALAAALGLRGFLISMLDNVYHYGTPAERGDFAYNLSAPRPVRLFLLNATYHGVHHHSPRAPWFDLPRECARLGQSLHQPLARQWLRQLRGPIPLERLSNARRT